MAVGNRVLLAWSVYIFLAFLSCCMSVHSDPGRFPNDEEFLKDFPSGDFEGTFLYSRFQALPEDRKNRYLSLSQNDLNRELAGCIWNDELLSPKAKKLFLCCMNDRPLQVVFVSKSIVLSPVTAYQYMYFYREDEEKFLQWASQVGAAIRDYSHKSTDISPGLIHAAMGAANAIENQGTLREQAVWSVLIGEPVPANRLDELRSSSGSNLMEFLEPVGTSCISNLAFLGQCFPNLSWETIWRERQPDLALMSFDFYSAIGILAERERLDLDGIAADSITDIYQKYFNQWQNARLKNDGLLMDLQNLRTGKIDQELTQKRMEKYNQEVMEKAGLPH